MIKFVEIYRDNTFGESQKNQYSHYSLRETYINPDHVVCLREESAIKDKIEETTLASELDDRQEFTKVFINRGQTGLDIVVVGSPESVEEKLLKAGKQLLRG